MRIEDEEALRHLYAQTKTIAVVGASGDPSKPAHSRPAYLQSQGFKVVPVSPRGGELFGEKVYETLADVDIPVDVVDVFRPAEEAPDIARAAVAIGAKVLWLQSGIYSDEAEAIADEGGLIFVDGMCMAAMHGQLGLGPGPD